MNEACLEGIRANGLRWKHTIRLGQWPAMLGKMNDREDEPSDVEVEAVAEKIVVIVRRFVALHPWAQETDLARRADELELVADCGLEEVNFAMGELYDSFDYHRILVEAPRLPSAQAIEARRAATGTGAVHESADPQGCAPKVQS